MRSLIQKFNQENDFKKNFEIFFVQTKIKQSKKLSIKKKKKKHSKKYYFI